MISVLSFGFLYWSSIFQSPEISNEMKVQQYPNKNEASLQCGWTCVSYKFQLDWIIWCNWDNYTFSFQCVPVFRFQACLDDLSHCAHGCFFSTVWHIKWFFRWAANLKDLLRCAHLGDFSPVRVSKCVASFLEDMMDLTQKVQMYLLAMSKVSIQLSFACWQ